jgi:hypothetical protein
VGSPFEILPGTVDLCSHGGIRLTIGGQVIALGEDDDEYGISESALALLRTLESIIRPSGGSLSASSSTGAGSF